MYDHIGLRVKDLEAAARFYGPKYYAAFLTDLDGNNVEAVCFN